MKQFTLKKVAMVSAVALGFVMSYNAAHADQILAPEVINVTATVNNTIAVALTDIAFGTIGAVKDSATSASLVIDTTGTITDSIGQGYGSAHPSSIVHDAVLGGATAGQIAITTGIGGANFFVSYGTFVNPVNGANHFLITNVLDDCDQQTGASAAGALPVVAPDTICHVTAAAGAATINIGARLTTEPAVGPLAALGIAYPNGPYLGSITAYISY